MGIAANKGWKLPKGSRVHKKGSDQIKIPSHLGYVFIPRHIAEKITSKGDQFGFKIQLETKDKNNRTYSGTLLTSQILTMMTEKKIR